jgi:hypothetical protein
VARRAAARVIDTDLRMKAPSEWTSFLDPRPSPHDL